MSNSFKKVVACLLAVLMVTFSVPFTALADVDTTEYTPDIQLQFGTLFQADGDNADAWVDNYADGYFENFKGKNASYDYTYSALSGPVLKATGSVSNDAVYSVTGLKIEAADTANIEISDDYEFSALTSDYNLKKGDAFTVTVRMDNVSTVFVGNAEICYSDNIEPLYGFSAGSGKSATYNTGTYAQLAEEFGADFTSEDAEREFGVAQMADWNTETLYGITSAKSGLKTDYDGVKYIYCENTGSGTNWSKITGSKAPTVIGEDGYETDMQGKSVMVTFAFILKEDLSASNPLQFSIHNGGLKAHTKDDQGVVVFSGFSEGGYSPSLDNTSSSAYTTYEENRFVSAKDQFGAEEENFGSRKMTFMGKNQNVAAPAPTHTHDFTGAEPAWTWADDNSSATATITCTAEGCDESEGYQISATDSDIASTVKTEGNCTTKAVNTLTAEVTLNGATVSTSKDVEGSIDATKHDYVGVHTDATCTANGFTTYTCSRCNDSYVEYDDPATTLEHSYTVPVSIAWDSDEAVTATVTLKCATCNATTTTAATVASVQKSAATCTADQVMTYTASYNGLDSISKDVTVPNTATDHAYELTSIDWDTLDTTTGEVKGNYVCANDSTHTKQETLQTTFEVIQQQTEDDPEITRFTYADEHKDVQTKAPAGHSTHVYTVPVSIAWDGEDAVTATVTLKCEKCDATTTTAATVASVQKSAATCTADQVMTYTASYNGLDSISKDVTVPDTATGHSWTANGITWDGADALTATANFVCDKDNKHTKTEVATVEKTLKTAATVSAPAVYTYTASYDGFDSISKDVQEGEALGVNITVPKYDVGAITLNGEAIDGTKVNTTNIAYDSTYTLEVTEGTEYFQGWEINGKIVEKATTYSSRAYADITVTPVFVVEDGETITVGFYDKFGNKVKEYKDVSVADYAAAIAADGIPTAQSYPSSKFVSWDQSDDVILNTTTSQTFWAIYEDVQSTQTYTVTVKNEAGEDITAATLDTAGFENGSIPYDTKVTVTDTSAKGWAIDGTTVSTATTYSFYVGYNVTIVKLDDATAEPTTTIIGANKLAEPTTYNRYNIVATRNIPDGYTLIDYGFVYGKNMTQDDLTIDNEGNAGTLPTAGNVKVARGSNNASNEFALNYGIKSPNNTVCARSFIVVKKGADASQVIYSDMFTVAS